VQAGGTEYRSQVLQATDIVELISQTVSLKKRGKDFVGLCPFHQEKTPSFHVSPSKQFFFCYGCKAGGNAIDFVIKRDRVQFIDAMRTLGEKAGIAMPRFEGGGARAGERQLLLDAQSAAGAHFQKNLLDERIGQPARDYLAKRGFNAQTIQSFQIGYAPEGWDGLLSSPLLKKFAPEQLLAAGLVKQRQSEGGFYDTFRNRLMFPIRDEQGRIIAFGGRVMPGSEDPAKYLNSPETPLFSKSRCVFALDLARQKIVETRTVAVVEGYTDVIMAHQYGASNVVSAMGTALTPQHVSILRRFADRLVLLFDPDTAGDLAVNRAVELFLTQPVEVSIATLPDKLDPDEYLLKYGAEAFEKLIGQETTDALSYKWKQLERQYRSSEDDLTGQQKAVEEYLSTLADARQAGPVDPIRWGASLSRVSRLTDIPVDQLNRRFAARRFTASRAPAAPVIPDENGEIPPAVGADSQSPAATPEPPRPMLPLAQELAERHLLGAMLLHPEAWQAVQLHVSPDDFLDPQRHTLATRYWDHQRNEGEPVFNEFLSVLEDPRLVELAVQVVDECEKLPDVNELVTSSVQYVLYTRQRRERARISAQLKRQDDGVENDEDAIDKLQKLTDSARTPDMRRGL
jgi:DNA primase